MIFVCEARENEGMSIELDRGLRKLRATHVTVWVERNGPMHEVKVEVILTFETSHPIPISLHFPPRLQ